MERNLLELRGPFGIPIELRQSAGLLALILVLSALMQGGGIGRILGFLAVLVGSVLLHELGHAWAARVQGVRVGRIVLHAGGGYCETGRATPRQEEFILLMGPLTTLALWAVCGLARDGIYRLALADPGWVPFGLALLPWLSLASGLNLFLFLYNMVPVQPLDGGRLLLVWLRRALPPQRALKIAGTVGLVACILWVPALVWVFFSTGWLLFFLPSFALHRAMARGERMP